MKTRIVQIGNSRGIRIPKLLLDQAGLGPDAEVELRATATGLEIRRVVVPRSGWSEAAAAARAAGDDTVLDGPTPFRRAQKFPDAASFRIALSSSASAKRRLSLPFSFSSSFRRFAWSIRRPPYSFF